MKKENLYIGCSGFYNNDWKGSLYPEDAKAKDFLAMYAQHFNAVEINSTFYRKPTAKTLLKWHEDSPEGFRFFIKIPKVISHEKRLESCKEEISEFCFHISSHLSNKLAGFLFQFPPSFKNTSENMDKVIQNLDFTYLNVIEFRHESWWNDDVFERLKEHHIVFSGVSFPGNLPETVVSNHSEVLYYRLHGKPVLYKSEYSEEFLKDLALNLQNDSRTRFIFFNNTWGTAAVENSLFLQNII